MWWDVGPAQANIHSFKVESQDCRCLLTVTLDKSLIILIIIVIFIIITTPPPPRPRELCVS